MRVPHGLLLAFATHEAGTAPEAGEEIECKTSVFRDLTFDMSGGPKGAKRPLGRPSMERLGD